jgi:hypothetical protein
VKSVEVGCIGVGWIGGLRAETLSRTALVDKLHLCDIKPDRLAEIKKLWKPATATLHYQDIIDNPNISVVYISTTPEANHYPIARDCLKGGKHVMLPRFDTDVLAVFAGFAVLAARAALAAFAVFAVFAALALVFAICLMTPS